MAQGEPVQNAGLPHAEPAAQSKTRKPYLAADGTLVIPFDSDRKYHWWKGGQSVALTRAEVVAWIEAKRAGQTVV